MDLSFQRKGSSGLAEGGDSETEDSEGPCKSFILRQLREARESADNIEKKLPLFLLTEKSSLYAISKEVLFERVRGNMARW